MRGFIAQRPSPKGELERRVMLLLTEDGMPMFMWENATIGALKGDVVVLAKTAEDARIALLDDGVDMTGIDIAMPPNEYRDTDLVDCSRMIALVSAMMSHNA